ncbi:formate hydrogenlyase subunit 4 [Peptoclostridium acidaminophilum DSM 3953]|uniref:Formate hydrogenlyase subunit 4 n=1 Tax=Peptoclostridium acidaminophilum DSM 3953 TaxID=1286171 RepID=W8T544_PEPAC|nr:NADH-quinone oxidoreductase subunit H [Peptoclostridium acidaminophilum]AHM55985.1 formate hydrogenlyase subunit 4 [Peptoclostridium acidaminophilum DSM 3953]
MADLSYYAIQMALFILVAPLVGGIINKIKAFTQKRKGAPIYQIYLDIIKLFTKDMVVSNQTSWVFNATPYIMFASSAAACAFVPILPGLAAKPLAGDVFIVIYILALGKFFMAISGFDAGSTFGGMGSSREMMIGALFEPSLIVAVLTLGFAAKSTSLSEIMLHSAKLGPAIVQPSYMLLLFSIVLVLIAESSRIPVDDPATHLELTMVHEAMILEYSGRHLALMELGAFIKQLIFITIIANVFIPAGTAVYAGLGFAGAMASLFVYIAKVAVISVVVALIEAGTVKLRFFSIPNLAALSFIASFVGFLQHFTGGGI